MWPCGRWSLKGAYTDRASHRPKGLSANILISTMSSFFLNKLSKEVEGKRYMDGQYA